MNNFNDVNFEVLKQFLENHHNVSISFDTNIMREFIAHDDKSIEENRWNVIEKITVGNNLKIISPSNLHQVEIKDYREQPKKLQASGCFGFAGNPYALNFNNGRFATKEEGDIVKILYKARGLRSKKWKQKALKENFERLYAIFDKQNYLENKTSFVNEIEKLLKLDDEVSLVNANFKGNKNWQSDIMQIVYGGCYILLTADKEVCIESMWCYLKGYIRSRPHYLEQYRNPTSYIF